MLANFLSKEIALSRFSVSHMSVFGTGGSLIPTVWGLNPGFYIPSRKEGPGPSLGRYGLVAAALKFSQW
jgi:hypothetical protein